VSLRPLEGFTHRRSGFTLLELMVVLLILALLASIAAPRVTHYLGRAKLETAKIQVNALSSAVDSFHLDMGRYPTAAEGLGALIARPGDGSSWDGPYVKKRDSLIDPWGRPYVYRVPGQHGDYDIYTRGAQEREHGASDGHDIGNW